jgi:hypothetical protein
MGECCALKLSWHESGARLVILIPREGRFEANTNGNAAGRLHSVCQEQEAGNRISRLRFRA